MQVALIALAIALVVVGLAGTVLPALPGAVLVFAGLVAAAAADDFTRVGWWTLALLAALTVVVYVIDFAAGAVGARRVGASRRAVWGAALGAIVGLFFGLAGIVLGPFVGAVAGEYSVRRELGPSSRAGAGAWLGLALAAAAKIALVFVMLGVFALAWLL